MIKKIRKLYDDKLFVAALSVIIMASPYPIISGWLLPRVGGFWTLCYMWLTLVLGLCHGLILITKMFPRLSVPDDEEELKATQYKTNIEKAFDEAHFLK